ncbi:unnamed protein product [Adineta steineri]|uniref:Uncharacterized protein n=1 Tax=Adineta steineri TaxID=433720 RepID=A0A818L0J5_9BILA|nr:unnamed protein product [Adineta steineri]CAF3561162.1 unnamed protein product [Adineta steineri]
MWRLANYIYRAFRNVATHRCPQDIIAPVTTACKKDDESNREEKQNNPIEHPYDIHDVIKNNQFSSPDYEKILQRLQKISFQQLTNKPHVIQPLEPPKIESIVKEIQQTSTPSPPVDEKEDILDLLLQEDETYMNALKNLSEVNEETMSIIDNQLGIEAIENGNVQLGIETLQISAKNGKNAAALYNLGVCYERGIGVEKDRAKACDYYRQASVLGHINAQFNLTLLSNHIDVNDTDDDEITEQTMTNKSRIFRFSFTNKYQEEPTHSWNDYSFNLTKTLACLS